MSGTATHPASAYRRTGMSREEFKSVIEQACDNYWGPGISLNHYRNVRVLVVVWERDLGDVDNGLMSGVLCEE